jgi:predicted nucleic acid-binding protein
MSFVLDSSVALAWLLPDEQGSPADELANRLEEGAVCAPALWPLEVGNALITAQRRKRLTERETELLLRTVQTLPVDLDTKSAGDSFAAVTACARKLGLTTYEAAYLELAQRRGLPLATLDQRLADAARKIGVPVIP